MSFFRSKPNLCTCKLCGKEVSSDFFIESSELCFACHKIAVSKTKTMAETLPEFQAKANAASDADERIIYLTAMLDLLYEYKVRYADNDVHIIEQNVDDLISEVIECISYARLP